MAPPATGRRATPAVRTRVDEQPPPDRHGADLTFSAADDRDRRTRRCEAYGQTTPASRDGGVHVSGSATQPANRMTPQDRSTTRNPKGRSTVTAISRAVARRYGAPAHATSM